MWRQVGKVAQRGSLRKVVAASLPRRKTLTMQAHDTLCRRRDVRARTLRVPRCTPLYGRARQRLGDAPSVASNGLPFARCRRLRSLPFAFGLTRGFVPPFARCRRPLGLPPVHDGTNESLFVLLIAIVGIAARDVALTTL